MNIMKIIVKRLLDFSLIYPLDELSRPLCVEQIPSSENIMPTIRKYQKMGFTKGVFYIYNNQPIDYLGTADYIVDKFTDF